LSCRLNFKNIDNIVATFIFKIKENCDVTLRVKNTLIFAKFGCSIYIIQSANQSISQSINQSISQYFIASPKVDQGAGQLSLTHVGKTRKEK